MNAVWFRLRAEARARWRAWVGMALLAGVLSGVVIAAFAGARRTQTAYDRFLVGTHAFDIAVTNGSTPDTINRQFDFDEIARLPQVVDSAQLLYYSPGGTTPSGKRIAPNDLAPLADPSGRFGSTLNGVRVLHGRLPSRANELAMSSLAADRLGVRAGETLQFAASDPVAATTGHESRARPFLIVGVIAIQGGLPPLTGGLPPLVLLAPAYARAHPDAAEVMVIRLRDGARGLPGFERELNRRAAGAQVVTSNRLEFRSAVQRSIDVQATALRLLGIVVAGVSLLLLGQAFTRLGYALAGEDGLLRALGLTRAQLRVHALGRGVAIGAGAVATATVTAVLLSALTPVGVARQAELHPGVAVNLAYVAIGMVAVLLTVALLSVLASFWTSRVSAARAREVFRATAGSRVSAVLAPVGRSPVIGTGVRMALEPGRGRTSAPVRSTIISAILGVAVVAGVVGLSASLARLIDQPRLYGWNWDVQLGDAFAPDLRPQARQLARSAEADGVAIGTISRVRIGGELIDALATEPVKGAVLPTVVDGTVPAAPSDIMLGTRTLRDLRLHVGDTVAISVGNRSARFKVVGRGVLTEFAGAARLGQGATLTFAGIGRVVPDPVANVVLVRARPGPAGDQLVAELARKRDVDVYLPARPSDLVDLSRVGGLPSVVAALLALMAVATLGHALFSSARRRRGDLAILKVLGFRRRQVSATIAWQATVVAVVGIVIGLPLGIGLGRLAWRALADRLGVPSEPVTPIVAMVIVAALALLVAILTAAIPARVAARTPPAVALRAE